MTPRPTKDLLDTDEREAIKEEVAKAASESGLHPETRVSMSVRTWIAAIVTIVSAVVAGSGGYFALARADEGLANRVGQAEKKVETSATKDDLKLLRMQMRMDLLSSVWECSKDERGGMRCSPKLPRGYEETGSR